MENELHRGLSHKKAAPVGSGEKVLGFPDGELWGW